MPLPDSNLNTGAVFVTASVASSPPRNSFEDRGQRESILNPSAARPPLKALRPQATTRHIPSRQLAYFMLVAS
jgi:hypothetical protein